MKLKSTPEDFQVEEQTSVEPGSGPHAFYRLTKSGLGTPEAISEILRQWEIPRHRISYGGLKDRHARTVQHVSIHHGPARNLSDRSYDLEYLGQIPRAFEANDIRSNRFQIRLRNISTGRRERLDHAFQQARLHGVINYFDDQRFGSLGLSGELIGAAWCLCNYERALYLALAEINEHDRPREREQKQILREQWGNWQKCKDMLDRSHRRSVVTFLVDHPTNFKRAVALIRQDLRGIYVAAFQSWVWNRWLSKLIDHVNEGEGLVASQLLPSKCGPLSLPVLNSEESVRRWEKLISSPLPLPSARQHEWPEGTIEALQDVLKAQNMEIREMRLKYPRDTFFSKGKREIVLHPIQMDAAWETTPRTEFINWALQFELPRGAYATMVIRQMIQDLPGFESESESDESDETSESEPQV